MNKVLGIIKINHKQNSGMINNIRSSQSMPECENINRDGEEVEN